MTKKREKILHTAISIDDLLYRKFDQMNQSIHEYAAHLRKTYKNVILIQREKDGIIYNEQIIDVKAIDGEGLLIKIR